MNCPTHEIHGIKCLTNTNVSTLIETYNVKFKCFTQVCMWGSTMGWWLLDTRSLHQTGILEYGRQNGGNYLTIFYLDQKAWLNQSADICLGN